METVVTVTTDEMSGEGGDDFVNGQGGSDTIAGGDGDDSFPIGTTEMNEEFNFEFDDMNPGFGD